MGEQATLFFIKELRKQNDIIHRFGFRLHDANSIIIIPNYTSALRLVALGENFWSVNELRLKLKYFCLKKKEMKRQMEMICISFIINHLLISSNTYEYFEF